MYESKGYWCAAINRENDRIEPLRSEKSFKVKAIGTGMMLVYNNFINLSHSFDLIHHGQSRFTRRFSPSWSQGRPRPV